MEPELVEESFVAVWNLHSTHGCSTSMQRCGWKEL